MLRSSPASAMQKTYDDCYLICSTAVYFEKQNNEDEALRSWRSALDNIYYFNAYKMSPNYRPKNETERALQDSLVTMERQCKERVDLLETLKESREEPEDDSAHSTSSSSKFRTPSSSSIPTAHTNGSRHDLPPPYPSSHRPQMPMRPQSRTAPSPPPRSSGDSSATTPALSVPSTKTSRTPSPDKKGGMLKSTLRPGVRDNSRQNGSRLNKTMRTPKPNAAGKAATLAWPAAPAPALSTDGLPASLATSSAQLPPPPNLRPTPPAHTSSSHRPQAQSTSPYMSRSARAPRSDPFAGFESSNEYASSRSPPTKSRQSRPLPTPLSANGVGGGARPAPLGPPTPPIRLPSDTAQDQHPQPNGLPTSVPQNLEPLTDFPSYRKEFLQPQRMETKKAQSLAAQMSANYTNGTDSSAMRRGLPTTPSAKRVPPPIPRKAVPEASATSSGSEAERAKPRRRREEPPEALTEDLSTPTEQQTSRASNWEVRVQHLMKNLPGGVDEQAAKAIFNEIVIKGDEVHWDDVAGLEIAKTALKEAVVYPFLRPDLFMGLREPARGMLLFGPPGTGKTMLARAVATESRSTFFAISASSLTSKFLGESEKLVRALFSIAKALAPSIIFVDEIDSLLSARGGSSEHEATRRIKTEFLIQWSDLAKAAAGRESADKTEGDATRVLVLAATNLPWAIDEAARRRFVRRQYIPLPEDYVRESQLRRLMSAQNYRMSDKDFARLVKLTDGFSGSDVTALAKDAAMGPLRSLGEKLLHMAPEDIRPISVEDFETSLTNIRPSVSKQGLKEFEDWAKEFGERGG